MRWMTSAVTERFSLKWLPVFTWIALALVGCGGGGGSSASGAAVNEGTFVDSPVEGLTYSTETRFGITDSHGRFRFLEGETVAFFIEDLELGQAPASQTLTPLDIVAGAGGITDQRVTNIARTLQSLDQDGNPDNGITLTAAITGEVSGRTIDFDLSPENFENNPDVQALFDDLNAQGVFTDGGVRALCSAEQAQNHLQSNLQGDDLDGDGFTLEAGDCNDQDNAIHPQAMEICGDGIDQDCSGSDLACPMGESEFEFNLRALINDYRRDNGLAALEYDPHLHDLAEEHSTEMDRVKTLSHEGFNDRFDRSEYNRAVENVAYNYPTPEALFEGWRISSGHNTNMLNPGISHAGISKVGAYATFFACGN
jgi:Cysteine-rich secretory protein family/Putative metal-binding motif